jgi:hypothetical protein
VNQHWEGFIEEISWFLQRDQIVEVEASLPPGSWTAASPEFDQFFPELYGVLREAIVTPVAVAGVGYQLYTWLRRDGSRCCWLSPLASPAPPPSLHPDHSILLRSFGGIVERSNEPDWWILNHNDVLTEDAARRDGTFITDYAWAFEAASINIPIDMEQFYAIAEEANGNITLCHRLSGAVVLFAPDHAFDYVEPFPGCPDYTLYRLPRALSFRDWVNTIARQWRGWIEGTASLDGTDEE